MFRNDGWTVLGVWKGVHAVLGMFGVPSSLGRTWVRRRWLIRSFTEDCCDEAADEVEVLELALWLLREVEVSRVG